MLENKEQFYLFDRWYYLVNEKNDRLSYSSNPDNQQDSIIAPHSLSRFYH